MSAAVTTEWESDIAGLLARLADAQGGLLALLAEKRRLIIARDHQALASLAPMERQLAAELQACQEQRRGLLDRATDAGLPHESLTDLNGALSAAARGRLAEPLAEARKRSELVRHECLAQWVAVQRSVLHLAQLLEIFATGGQARPTYGSGIGSQASGSLIDQAV
ncbi:MAG: flagellar export chaperone FlgN [Pirellulales bacterium]|nr:flagellar export chaperone FlgN [Pirellulales bacterium]MBX3432747.1 flagellar export chaperone FlgN [Pirellulales bacterium]